MSTYMPKKADLSRKWYIIDAEGRSLGHVAAAAAHILRGKHKPTFAPHADCGDNVVVINASKTVLTGNKLDKKKYYRHSGWIGGLKETSYRKLMAERPEFALLKAVKGMLPDTTLGRNAATRIRVYRGADHKQAAQKPETWNF
ncbi:MAG: 50S ribosomal protein L13 [Oscillospiraceae bacterium]|nr:50S ribosomal protein L13 [Oscillospiraceae bacterium]